MRKLPAAKRRTVIVMVRLNAEEAREIRAAAKTTDPYEGLGTWMRVAALKAARRLEGGK